MADYKMIEELTLNNWQPLQTMLYDGWLLRFAGGYTKRANSVNPILYSTADVNVKIKECERLYTYKELSTVFKITPFVHPNNLDELLGDKGYALIERTSVQILSLDRVKQPTLTTVVLDETLTSEWLDTYCRLNNVELHKHTMHQMLSNIVTKKCFISLYHQQEVIACGLAVIEREWLGLFDIVTAVNYRKRGFGEQLILNLLQWGRDHGAKSSHLAVVLTNQAALNLYAKIGYHEIYRYWYRVKQ
ncbi:MAG: family N-acetyltransferase, partial [Bacilli bacterium]|nr:family N-acetyltransferase [Bacilli bacterium]